MQHKVLIKRLYKIIFKTISKMSKPELKNLVGFTTRRKQTVVAVQRPADGGKIHSFPFQP